MDFDTRTKLLGEVLGNFQSLEFLLRLFLGKEEFFRLPLRRVKPGDTLPECAFTDWDSLGQLIARVNSQFLKLGLPQRIDPSLVKVRDALAHGRVFMPADEDVVLLFKFGRPRKGRVTVETKYVLTEDMMGGFRGRVSDAIEMVGAALDGNPWHPDLSAR